MAEVESDKQLRKELTFPQLLFLSLGGIIGSGWLFAVLSAAGVAGPAVIISWIVGGVLVIFIALNYAEVAGMIPKSGAIVRYPHYTHGSLTGYILGWAYLLSAVTVPTIEAEAVVGYFGAYLPTYFPSLPALTAPSSTLFGTVNILTIDGIVVAFVLLVIFFFINFFGIKFLGKFTEYIGYWKLLIPTLTFILLYTVFQAGNLTAGSGGFTPFGLSAVFLAIPTAGIVFAFLGFRQALEFGGEAKNPQRDIPRATVFSVIIALVLYTLLQIAFIGAITWSSAGVSVGDWQGLAGSAWSSGPLYTALRSQGTSLVASVLGAFAVFLLIDAIISPSGTGWVYTGTSSRVLYGMATDGYYPKQFMALHEKYKIPWMALLASLVVGVIFLLPFPSWYLLVGFISSATVFTYIMGGVALTVFRKTAPSLKRPFTLPLSQIIAPIGFLAALLIVYWSGYVLETFLVYAILIGFPIYMIFYVPKKFDVQDKLSVFVIMGVAYWAILILLLYFNLNSVLTPAVQSLTAATPAAPSNDVFLWFTALWIILVIITLAATYLIRYFIPKEHYQQIDAAWWLLGLILILLPLSFLGGFGPYLSSASALIPFPYDNLVVIIVGIIFYYLAIRSGFQTQDIVEISKESGAS